MSIRRSHTAATVALALLSSAAVSHRAAAQPGALFPEAFRVEHHLEQEDGEGTHFVGEPVVDTYGGSWVVSERPDGSRLVVDLVRRELTEVRPLKGTYWTLSFDRFAELQARLRAAQGLAPAAEAAGDDPRSRGVQSAAAAKAPARELVVTELTDPPPAAKAGEAQPGTAMRSSSGTTATTAPSSSTGAAPRRLRVARRGDSDSANAMEVWVDPSLRLSPQALAALGSLDQAMAPVPDEEGSAASAPGRYLAAARTAASGGFTLRTQRPAVVTAEGKALGRIEDVSTRLERLERFPAELVEIPEGLRRVPHPLEATVRFLEEEATRNAAMAGAADGVNR